jgi:pimeloyl-ACP methyl ester carboxylesterase
MTALPADADVRYVDLAEHRLRYLRTGSDDAPPVVLLHGGGLDEAALSWRDVLAPLGESFRVYAPDFPGYGGSDDPTEPPDVDSYAGVVERFLDALALDEVSLVGLSLGGGVALDVAFRAPERLDRLVLVDSYGLGGRVPGGRLGTALIGAPRLTELTFEALRASRLLTALAVRAVTYGPPDDELIEDVYAALQRPGSGRAWRGFQRREVGAGSLRTNFVDRLPDLAVPTLFVHGEHDRLVPVEWAVRAGSLVPDAEVRIVPRCGHWPPREAPRPFLDCLEAFLQSPSKVPAET